MKNKLITVLLFCLFATVFLSVFQHVPSVKAESDPIFSTVYITSIHTCPLDSHTFVIAYCDETNDDFSFQIWDTNGTQVLAEIDVDTTSGDGIWRTSIGVSAFNSTVFVVGWNDRADSYVAFAVYNKVGTLLSGPTKVDTTAGTSYSVQVSCFNSTYFVIGWFDDPSDDQTFAVYTSSSVLIAGPVDVDTEAGPTSYAVSVSAFNSTTFVIAWYSADYGYIKFAVYDSHGTLKTGPIDVDTSMTYCMSVSVSTLNSTYFVIGWHDEYYESNYYYEATFAVYTSSGTLKAGPTDVDTSAGHECVVQVAALNSTRFVISWYDSASNAYDLSFGIYLNSGSTIKSPTDIESWPTAANDPFKFHSPCSQESATGIGFSSDIWVIAYANTTTQAIWREFYPNGTEVPAANTAPTNDALTLDLTGANYKGTKTLLTAKQDYKFVYKASDVNGVTDITYAEIRLDYTSKNVVLRATRGTGDSWTFTEQSDPSNYVTLGTCSDSTSGTQKTFNFYVKINWAWGDSAETIGVRAYVIDSQSASDQDDYSNVFGVECHLASSSLSVNDYRVNPSQTLTMSGYWYYNGTAVIPPDGDYQVKIKLSGTQKGSTDTTLVSGAFSISDVTAESTVNSYTYQVFANYNASAGSFNAVVVDKARVYYEQLDDSRANINANIEFRIKAILLFDNHALGTGDTVTANFGSLTWDAGNNWFDGSRTQATVGSYVFQISSLTEVTYGITSFEINVTDPTGVYDRIRIDSISVVDGRIDINTEGSFYATASLEFDSHTLGSGDFLSLSSHAFTWVPSRSRFEYNTTQSSVLHVTIDSFTSGNEATYGITGGNINSKSGTIIWDRIQVSFVANTTGPVLNEVVLFTVTLTREYDSSSISSYSYNINRNGSAFGNPHSTATFTDVQSSQITYVYDFVSVTDNTYDLTAFVDPNNITVKWTSTNHAPTICDFSAPAGVYAGQYIFVNATAEDIDGRTQIANATIELSGNVILKWLNTFNTFSIQSDPNNYVTLNQSACLRTILNDTAYLLSWNLKFAWNYSYATPSIIVTNTKVYDMYSSYGSNSKSDLFAFKDDLIVASASVNPVETTPETNVVFSGTIYYYNTTMPPYYTTGVTVYLELDGLLQGATTTITSSGAWTKTTRCPATTGNKTYVVYVMTDEIGVANKTVNLFVMSTGPIGGGYFFPSTPTYRPENYTYTPPTYVPQEIAVPTGLEGLGLNLLIVAVVGATVLGVGASVIKPSRPSLASKIRVKRASSADYEKRLRRPKRKVKD
jgi:hypothetical protein